MRGPSRTVKITTAPAGPASGQTSGCRTSTRVNPASRYQDSSRRRSRSSRGARSSRGSSPLDPSGLEPLAHPVLAEVGDPAQAHLRDRHRAALAHGVDDPAGLVVRLDVDLREVVAALLVEAEDPLAPGRDLLLVEEAGARERQQRPQVALAEGREAAKAPRSAAPRRSRP